MQLQDWLTVGQVQVVQQLVSAVPLSRGRSACAFYVLVCDCQAAASIR